MLRYQVRVSDSELALITVMRDLRFGEIFSADIEARPLTQGVQISPNVNDLLQLIRNGTQHIDVLTVHEGEPVLAEIDYERDGFRCRKRIKFPTTKAEGK